MPEEGFKPPKGALAEMLRGSDGGNLVASDTEEPVCEVTPKDPYDAQMQAFRDRQQEVAVIQSAVMDGDPDMDTIIQCLIEYGYDCKYIRFLLQELKKALKND